jgi:hypothetical protein
MPNGTEGAALAAPIVTKQCRICLLDKPMSEFHRIYGSYRGTCKGCRRVQVEIAHARNQACYASVKMKRCESCETVKPVEDFYKAKTQKDGRWAKCIACVKSHRGTGTDAYRQQARETYAKGGSRWATQVLSEAKRRAVRQGVPFNLSRLDIAIPPVCPILGIPLIIGQKTHVSPNSPTLDRIVPSRGYVRGNVLIISWLANKTKGNITDPSVFEAIAAYLRRSSA